MNNKKTSKFKSLSLKRKMTIISITAILVLLASVGTTIAFLAMRTGSIKNIFEPVSIECQVNDSDYTVANTGDYSAYIRASVIVNYVKNDDTKVVYGVPPIKDTDYTIAFDNSNWIKGSDGFYYYKTPVNPKLNNSDTANVTSALVTSFSVTDAKKQITSKEGTFNMKVQILAEAIQSKPTTTVEDKWNVRLDGSGNITGKK